MKRSVFISLAVVLGFWLLAPALAPHDPMQTNPDNQLLPPSFDHIFGTDLLGRDVFSRVLHGGQRTISMSLAALMLATVPGLGLGLSVGMLQGRWERFLSSALNVIQAFPSLLLALVIITLLGTGVWPAAIATGLPLIAPFARIVEAATRRTRAQTFIDAARSLGATDLHILRYGILMNIRPAVGSAVGVIFGFCVLNNAALNFLGLGSAPGVPDWGAILAEARLTARSAPWAAIAPGAAITALVMFAQHISVELAAGLE